MVQLVLAEVMLSTKFLQKKKVQNAKRNRVLGIGGRGNPAPTVYLHDFLT